MYLLVYLTVHINKYCCKSTKSLIFRCQHVVYLEERNPKRDPCDDSQVALHRVGHQCEAALHGRKIKIYRAVSIACS